MKFGDRFENILGIKNTKFNSNLFIFHIFIVQCLGFTFLPDTVYLRKDLLTVTVKSWRL